MKYFYMNGYLWRLIFADPYDENLVDRTNHFRLGTTNPNTRSIYISNEVCSDMFTVVLLHELGHCAMVSYGLLEDIHRMVYPEYWIEAEEWVCNFIADYGSIIFNTASRLIGTDAVTVVAREIDRMFA